MAEAINITPEAQKEARDLLENFANPKKALRKSISPSNEYGQLSPAKVERGSGEIINLERKSGIIESSTHQPPKNSFEEYTVDPKTGSIKLKNEVNPQEKPKETVQHLSPAPEIVPAKDKDPNVIHNQDRKKIEDLTRNLFASRK